MMRKLRLTWLMLGPSGELFRSDMAGPMTYDQWEARFMVFRSAMVMLDFASPSSLDGYRDHVRQFSTQFGPQCWVLLYQTDTRARREHAERLRRRANIELTALDAIGVKGAYNPKSPWEYVFRQLPVEFAFWKRELEDPALLILARAPVAAITSEAPVAKTRDQHITQVAGDVWLYGLGRQDLPSKRQRVEIPSLARVYEYDDQGHNKCNRRGVQLCAAFQTGSCSSPCPQQLAHQCKICLYPTHGAKDCPKAGMSVPQQAGHTAEKEKGKKQKGRGQGKKPQW